MFNESVITNKPDGATHWAVLPDKTVLYYKITNEVLLFVPFSKIWERPGLVPYTLHCFDDYE